MARSHESAISGPDDRLLKKAQRLAAVAQAVEAIDLKSIAAAYQKEAGGSIIEAGTVATVALNAALKASLGGGDGQAAEAAEREVKAAAKKRAREVRSEDFRAARAAEDGIEGEAARAAKASALEARGEQAVADRAQRLNGDIEAKRALREERQALAASRRSLSEARARIGISDRKVRTAQSQSDDSYVPASHPDTASSSSSSPLTNDDPVLQRARNLLKGASRVVAELDEQNNMLRQRYQALSKPPPAPPRPRPASAPRAAARGCVLSNTEEDALVARAKELLSDYKPDRGPSRSGPATPKRSGQSRPLQVSGTVSLDVKRGSGKFRY